MKPLSILLTAVLVALPAASVAHTCKCGGKRRPFIFCLQLLHFGRQGHRMTMMKSSVQSTKDILTMTLQLHTPGKSRWISTWNDTHGDIDRAYPHIFKNKENLDFKHCKKGTLVEYPLKNLKHLGMVGVLPEPIASFTSGGKRPSVVRRIFPSR